MNAMMGYMYILECADGSYYVGSTTSLGLRIEEHQNGQGSNHTKMRLPVKLVYFEEYPRIDLAFYREKQVQGWSRKKMEALIKSKPETLRKLAECRNQTHYKILINDHAVFDCAQTAPHLRWLSGVEASGVEASGVKVANCPVIVILATDEIHNTITHNIHLPGPLFNGPNPDGR